MSAQHTPTYVRAFYVNRRGVHCVRLVQTEGEAEKIMRGGYGALDVRMELPDGTIVGRRERNYGLCDDRRVQWVWYFERDVFQQQPKSTCPPRA